MWRVSVLRDPEHEEELAVTASDFPVLGMEFEHQDDGQTEFLIWLRDGASARLLAARIGGEAVEVREPELVATPTEPLAAGSKWWITPPDWSGETPAGRIRLEFRTGNSFGHGDHATTQLCLEAMERYLQPGEAFLDVGCGSGLLMDAARALGGNPVWGCDPDPVASPDWRGSVDAVSDQAVDFAVANIQIGVLHSIWADLDRCVRRAVTLSGFLVEQAAELPHTPGWEAVETLARDGWGARVLKRTTSL